MGQSGLVWSAIACDGLLCGLVLHRKEKSDSFSKWPVVVVEMWMGEGGVSEGVGSR